MEYGIDKCAMHVMKRSKWHIVKGVELPNKLVIRTPGEKETYMGILEADTLKPVEIKQNIKDSVDISIQRIEDSI